VFPVSTLPASCVAEPPQSMRYGTPWDFTQEAVVARSTGYRMRLIYLPGLRMHPAGSR
jgi:hypothetical protein